MSGMEFQVSFLVDEEHLGPVMAALYRVGDINHLMMTPVVEMNHVPTRKAPAPEIADHEPKQPHKEAADLKAPFKVAKTKQKPSSNRKGRGPNGTRLADLILAKMAELDGGVMPSENMRAIAEANQYSTKGLYSCLDRLIKQKRVTRVSSGLYSLIKGNGQ